MTDEHVVLSERPEDQLKAVEWAREQKKKILDDKSRRIADALMEKSATLNLRVNPTLKSDAEKILSRLGIPMSTAVDMFLNQIVFRLFLLLSSLIFYIFHITYQNICSVFSL